MSSPLAHEWIVVAHRTGHCDHRTSLCQISVNSMAQDLTLWASIHTYTRSSVTVENRAHVHVTSVTGNDLRNKTQKYWHKVTGHPVYHKALNGAAGCEKDIRWLNTLKHYVRGTLWFTYTDHVVEWGGQWDTSWEGWADRTSNIGLQELWFANISEESFLRREDNTQTDLRYNVCEGGKWLQHS
jgi:hypothetical protein